MALPPNDVGALVRDIRNFNNVSEGSRQRLAQLMGIPYAPLEDPLLKAAEAHLSQKASDTAVPGTPK